MKAIWSVILLAGCAGLSVLCETDRKPTVSGQEINRQDAKSKCAPNPDFSYDRKKVLNEFAEVLNKSAPDFKQYEKRGFYVDDERPQNFFVFDLTDPSNKSIPSSGCVNFIDNHIYHFAAHYLPFSFSNVAILENSKPKFFKAINCENSKDSVDDVIRYVEKRQNPDADNEIVQRVREYRKYGRFSTIDDVVIRCKQSGFVKRDVQ